MKQLILGSLLAAVVLFFWGFIFFGILPNPGFEEPTDAAAVWQSMADHLPASGAYFVPDPEGDAQAIARHETGPTGLLFVRAEGSSVMPASMMVGGFIHMFVTALLIGLLLRMVWPQFSTYGRRVLFIVALGVTASFWADLAWPVWWRTPWTFFLWLMVYDVAAWALAGAVMARFVKPESVRTPAAVG